MALKLLIRDVKLVAHLWVRIQGRVRLFLISDIVLLTISFILLDIRAPSGGGDNYVFFCCRSISKFVEVYVVIWGDYSLKLVIVLLELGLLLVLLSIGIFRAFQLGWLSPSAVPTVLLWIGIGLFSLAQIILLVR